MKNIYRSLLRAIQPNNIVCTHCHKPLKRRVFCGASCKVMFHRKLKLEK